MSERYPSDLDGPPDPNRFPITVCTPSCLGVTLNLVNQRIEPTGPFIELLNRFPLEQLEEELARVDANMAQLNTARQLLDLAIQARRAANGGTRGIDSGRGSDSASVGVRPPLKQAILAVMADGPAAYAWTPSEIHSALDDRGWAPTGTAARAQISNRLSGLVDKGQVGKPDKGKYVLLGGD